MAFFDAGDVARLALVMMALAVGCNRDSTKAGRESGSGDGGEAGGDDAHGGDTGVDTSGTAGSSDGAAPDVGGPGNDGATYYIAIDGDDDNPGTLVEPFGTFEHAIDVVQPGDTIYVRGGTYMLAASIEIDKSGAPDEPIRSDCGRTPTRLRSSISAIRATPTPRSLAKTTRSPRRAMLPDASCGTRRSPRASVHELLRGWLCGTVMARMRNSARATRSG